MRLTTGPRSLVCLLGRADTLVALGLQSLPSGRWLHRALRVSLILWPPGSHIYTSIGRRDHVITCRSRHDIASRAGSPPVAPMPQWSRRSLADRSSVSVISGSRTGVTHIVTSDAARTLGCAHTLSLAGWPRQTRSLRTRPRLLAFAGRLATITAHSPTSPRTDRHRRALAGFAAYWPASPLTR